MKTMKFGAKQVLSLVKIIFMIFCLVIFLYQVWEIFYHYQEENVFKSTKTQTYKGKWVTPVITICPDPAILDPELSMEDLHRSIARVIW